MKLGTWSIVSALLLCAIFSNTASAQQPAIIRQRLFRMNGRIQVAPGGVPMPYTQQDGAGNQWVVNAGGWIRENGPQPVIGQGEMLTVDGQNPGMNGGPMTARMDPKTGELLLDNLACGDCVVTRRILISKTDAGARYIDIIKNNSNQEQNISVNYQSSSNYGINNGAVVNDPKHSENPVGWVGLTGINQAMVEVFAGTNDKGSVPAVTYQQNSNVVQAAYELKIPAGKSSAILHILTVRPTYDAGQQFIQTLNESALLHGIPTDVRKIIVNFGAGNQEIGEYEILRGDTLDVVELHSGDQIKGTLKEDTYKLQTFYGPVELAPPHVIAILNIGQFRPHQLLVTVDGQVFGGKLDKDSVSMELSSGQVTQIPLSQISRIGYRRQSGEPDEWTFDTPIVLMRTGERVKVQMPAGPFEVNTRYGVLKLDTAAVAAIAFQSDDSPVHEIFLTDGSHFSGLVTGDVFEMTLMEGAQAPVKFPASSIMRLQLSGKATDPDDSTPTLTLSNDELLVGSLTGQMKLDTSFDTLQINGPEIKRITRASPTSSDVQITLWDNTTVSGQLEDPTVQCHMLSGADMSVPVSMFAEYNQPLPRPSASMIGQITDDVKQLSADDWKQREKSEADLVAVGPSVISVLKDFRAAQSPEAQARIDSIIKQLSSGAAPANKPQ